ncbi:MAG: histidine kinase [Deltaproteobacteria bacterium]|nr:histidine kinase [Deltaproteobacteria bacterium]
MWKRISLRIRIYVLLTFLVSITLFGALVTVWYTYRMQSVLTYVLDEHVTAFQLAASLEIALVNQKGFVSYYFLDNNPAWLQQLAEYRLLFKEQFARVQSLPGTQEQMRIVNQIAIEYDRYAGLKDKVIAYYKAGERDIGSSLHKKVRGHFFKTLELCGDFKMLYVDRISAAKAESRAQAKDLRAISIIAMGAGIFLAILLGLVLVRQILGPVKRIALEAARADEAGGFEDEVTSLSRSVKDLIEDIDNTQTELEKSRESLLQSEKMVLVGKLAAGTAHSIRNPLTSVKMRLFSLSRSLELLPTQKEDFDVITEEIRHIDTIVQNFLEFSRPPRLKMQTLSPSSVVDATVQLLKYRLQSYDVNVYIEREKLLPEIQADPEQLKEVLVNLVVNACEVMENGGDITIKEYEGFTESLGRVAIIRLNDNGPGITKAVGDLVFEPFFTTKEEGTGLGLSIAARIIDEHGGRLDLVSDDGRGAEFVITLPIQSVH